MLERIFGSTSRGKIIKFFCTHGFEKYYVRELARLLDIKLNALSRELDNLVHIGFLRAHLEKNRKYYAVDPSFPLLAELKALIVKSIVLLEKAIIKDMDVIHGIQVFILTGIFVGAETGTDLLLVGKINKAKVQSIIHGLSKSFYQNLRFTVLSPTEYKYRLEVTDKFIHTILSTSPIIIVNNYSG